ncbi:M15 family metallopeptidase [Terrarubrum flagellatum]|uniref:M15 family metallopeptidase n=1 Tax=Terrirubrum flagellatum TaxID=2895980 RepID=UPI003144E11F
MDSAGPRHGGRGLTIRAGLAALGLALALGSPSAQAGALPSGFVYLRDVDSSIQQDIRYAGAHNFVGRPIAGYAAAECVLTEKAAERLRAIQAELLAQNLSLIVWDCYRPMRAVADFVAWSRNPADAKMKQEFYPRIDKARLFALGYVSSTSAHTRGGTVDLGLTAKGASAMSAPTNCAAQNDRPPGNGVLDFGVGFDCMDELAHLNAKGVDPAARRHRETLRSAMERHGFRGYAKEWWHFQLVDEPFPTQGFDFPITPRQ